MENNIQRFDVYYDGMDANPDGLWVKYDDMQSALESANAEITALKSELNEYDPNLSEEKSRLSPQRFIDALKAENEELREELANLKSDREHLETVNNTWAKRDGLLQSEITKLKEEISAEKADKQRVIDIGVNMQRCVNDKVEAENAKLRVALERIGKYSSREAEIAREALNYIYGGIND